MLSANIVEAANVIVNEGFIERRANNNAFIKHLSFTIVPWKQLFLKYIFIKWEQSMKLKSYNKGVEYILAPFQNLSSLVEQNVHSWRNDVMAFYNAWIHIHVYTSVELSLEN